MTRRGYVDRKRLLQWVVAGCALFVLLTLLAMLTYPGGLAVPMGGPAPRGYSFFRNFFSDLGRTVSPLGEPNTLSFALFVVALTGAGLSLGLFSLVMPSLCERPRAAWVLSRAGAFFGIVAGLSFVGVAWTPADLLLAAHKTFVQVAFLSLFVGVLGYLAALLLVRDYPRRYLAVFAAFALLLVGYLWLLFFGPALDSTQGLLIQATGQKVIVYAGIVSVGMQALGAQRVLDQIEGTPGCGGK